MDKMEKTALEKYAKRRVLQRFEVDEIAEEAGFPRPTVTVLLQQSEAVKFRLPCRRKPLYIRRVVLELLGLDQPE